LFSLADPMCHGHGEIWSQFTKAVRADCAM
jgi:hypothetical protein